MPTIIHTTKNEEDEESKQARKEKEEGRKKKRQEKGGKKKKTFTLIHIPAKLTSCGMIESRVLIFSSLKDNSFFVVPPVEKEGQWIGQIAHCNQNAHFLGMVE